MALVSEGVENGGILNLSFCFTKPTAHLPPRPDGLHDICWEVTCCLLGYLAPEGFPENLGKGGGAESVTSQSNWSLAAKLCVCWGGGGRKGEAFLDVTYKKGVVSCLVAASGGQP